MVPRRDSGFTLIEILIVIGILGALAAALLPRVLGAGQTGEIADTTARIQFLAQAANAFERRNDYYPPSDFHDPTGAVRAKNNNINSGIESLVLFLCQKRLGNDSIADHEEWLKNTDNDKASQEIPLLERRDLVEVVDAWGMPIVYFSSKTGGYGKPQRVCSPEGETVKVSALINPRTGKNAASRKYQLFSAGPDGLFGTDDDVTHPVLEKE